MIRFSSLALAAALGFTSPSFAAHAESAPGDELSALLALDEGPGKDGAGQDGPRHRRPEGKGEGKGEGRPGGEIREHMRERIMHALFKDITLDDAEKAAIEKIHKENAEKREVFMKEHKQELDAFHETMKKWYGDHKAAFEAIHEKMKEARQSKDEDAAKKAREELKALLETRPKMPEALKAGMFEPEKVEGQIRAILHPDQVAQFDKNVQELKEMRKKMEDGGFPGGPRGPEGKGGPEGKDGEGRPHRRGGPVKGGPDADK